jgi:hypothetical protein
VSQDLLIRFCGVNFPAYVCRYGSFVLLTKWAGNLDLRRSNYVQHVKHALPLQREGLVFLVRKQDSRRHVMRSEGGRFCGSTLAADAGNNARDAPPDL